MKNNNSNKKSFSFSSLFRNNRFLMFFSIAASFLIWLWVAVEKSPEIQTVITNVPVTINLENSIPQQLNLQIFGESEFTVDVTVTGKKYILSNLSAEDIKVEANTNYVDSAGMKTLQLKVVPVNSSNEFKISSVSETFIEVFFDNYKEAEFSLNGNVESTLESFIPEGCLMGDIVFSNNTVTVSGPATEISRIVGVSATATVNEVLEKTTTFNPVIKLEVDDDSELEYSKINLSEAEVTMTIPVLKVVSLPTAVEFKNAPSYYIDNPLSYTVYPSTVKVAVPVDALETTKHFVVDSIDFSDIANSYNTFNIDASTTNSLKLVDESVKNFRVRINADDMASKTFVVPSSKIIVKNSRDDFNISIDNNKDVSVTIIGPADSLEALTSEDIILQIDAADKVISADTKSIHARAIVNGDVDCWAFGKYDIKVKVSPK